MNGLKFLDVAIGCGWGPDWNSVVHEGTDDRFVREGYGFFVLAP